MALEKTNLVGDNGKEIPRGYAWGYGDRGWYENLPHTVARWDRGYISSNAEKKYIYVAEEDRKGLKVAQ